MAQVHQPVSHNLLRKQILAVGHPVDNAGKVTAVIEPTFDLSATIFKSLPPGIKTFFQRTKLDTKLVWSDAAQAEVERLYEALRPPVHKSLSDDAPIYKFMAEQCDFSCEHADGSFLDHLNFCKEYALRHYTSSAAAPRVLFLHSIMGVGTNCFPMTIDKLPALSALLTPEELTHVQAFPSVLRSLIHGPLLAELMACPTEKLHRLTCLRLHRVMDNENIELNAAQLWEHLNFQLIHSIDFLPAAAWKRTSNEYFFAIFLKLFALLSRVGQLTAKVEWDDSWMKEDTVGARPNTWRHWLIDIVPNSTILALASKQIAQYSGAIGHSLEYELRFDATPASKIASKM